MQSICSQNDNFTNKYNELNNALGMQIKQIIPLAMGAYSLESDKYTISTIDLSSYGFKKRPVFALAGLRYCEAYVSTITTTELNLVVYNSNSKAVNAYVYANLIEFM